MKKSLFFIAIFCFLASTSVMAQDYFFKSKGPFAQNIPSPEEFLGYPIGAQHTRHDQIVAYLERLAEVSDRAVLTDYGKTYERRRLVILTISAPENLNRINAIQEIHLKRCDPNQPEPTEDIPILVNLGYNVHGNEPSSSEAAMLTAYTLVAGESDAIKKYREGAIVFVDPTINPDGRDRHTQWANTYQGNPLVSDPMDIEHNEGWPRGRTNHYWFDLNRDWLLGIHPESRGKLNWYHSWYPNVVTDFHEMGTNATYFFEPMKDNGSKNPIMPKENYTTLNEKFAEYFSDDLDEIGSLYFTKERFDGTYPGYGSSYPDLQGGLGLLFEQASSRGHVQDTPMGQITFPFTIRNQYVSSLATVRASVENKSLLQKYQRSFFTSATQRGAKNSTKGYVFGDAADRNRTNAFIDKLLLHRVKVYQLKSNVSKNGKSFDPGSSYYVPTQQAQYRMVQTMFETYKEYADSVFYDASAWSVANFYNMPYAPVTGALSTAEEVKEVAPIALPNLNKSSYAYLIPWEDYNTPALLNYVLSKKVKVTSAFKPFSISTNDGVRNFGYGTLMIPVQRQEVDKDTLFDIINTSSKKFNVPVYTAKGGYSTNGVDLGSLEFRALKAPKLAMLVGDGVSSYEAGEVWHLLDQRMEMPISKLPLRRIARIDLDKYTNLVMVSGNYAQLDSIQRERIKNWVSKGNTLITIRGASKWAVEKKLVSEKLIASDKPGKSEIKNKATSVRQPYVNAPENRGRHQVGGAIFEVELDLTHPLAFGYTRKSLPVYRNSTVWLTPSKNAYSTVAKYTSRPHMDGFITAKNLNKFLKPSASLIVSKIGEGRVIMFADNPNFRGSWYGTNKLFLNALFLGNHISVPEE